jgi:hypothetical protein
MPNIRKLNTLLVFKNFEMIIERTQKIKPRNIAQIELIISNPF